MAREGSVEVRTAVTLGRYARRLEIRTEITNRKHNHRLRALFLTDTDTDYATADGQFDIVRRPVEPWRGWQNPSNCQPQQAFVDVSDNVKGLTIANIALPEYEILRDGHNTVAVTLLRAVGEIGDWGDFPTPDAQCESTYIAEYSVIPHAGPLESSKAQQEAHCFNWMPNTISADIHPGDLPPSGSFLSLEPDTLVLSAVKKCETRDSVIVRFYNPREDPCEARLGSLWPVSEAFRTNLEEKRLDSLSVEGSGLRVHVKAKEIVTVELVPGER